LTIAGLVDKLLEANAVEKTETGLVFTPAFGRFLLWCIGGNMARAATIEGWRSILSDYDQSLGSLSANEVAALIRLLEYSVNRPDTSIQGSRKDNLST